MAFGTILISALVALVSMLAVDAVWLACMGPRLYRPRIGHLMAKSPRWAPAVAFYLIYIAGLSFFVLEPAIAGSASVYEIFLTGAFFGLVTYATYDLTNHATLVRWPLLITVIDLVWGSLLTGGVAVFATRIATLAL